MKRLIVGSVAAVLFSAAGAGLARADNLAPGQNSNLCLDWNTSNNAVALWPCHGGYNQTFFSPAPGPQRFNTMCLDQSGPGQGAGLVMAPCRDAPTQRWTHINNTSDPSYGRVRNDAGLCINVPNGDTRQNVQVIAWPCQTGTRGGNDIWLRRNFGSSPPRPVAQAPMPAQPYGPPAPPPAQAYNPQQQPYGPTAPGYGPPGINRQTFNFNAVPAACPGGTTLTFPTDRFADGSPLPFCDAREVNGSTITTYRMVWTGQFWGKFLPSVQIASLASVPLVPAQPGTRPGSFAGNQPASPNITPGVDTSPAQLDAISEAQDVFNLSLQIVDNMQALVDVMGRDSQGDDALWDPEVVQSAKAGVAYARYLIAGPDNPYSLQRVVSGGAVALNETERRDLNRMFADSGMAGGFRNANAMIVKGLRQMATPATASYAPRANPRLVPIQFAGAGLRQWGDLQQAKNFQGLDRAQQLASVLTLARGLNSSRIFLEYSTMVESRATAAMERLINTVGAGISANPAMVDQVAKNAAEAKVLRVLKAYTLAKLAVQMSAVTLNAVVAIMPTSISVFYLTVDNTRVGPNMPERQMAVGASSLARIYVVPHSPGGTLMTPLGVISMIGDAGFGPRISQAFDRLTLGANFAKRMSDEFKFIVKTLSARHMDANLSFLSNYRISQWASAIQDTIQLPGFDNKPVEVNDGRVVRLSAGPVGAEHLTIGSTPDRRFTINAVSPGVTGITGELMLADLYSGGGEKFFRAAIRVTGTPPPPQAIRPGAVCRAGSDSGVCNPYTHRCEVLGGGVLLNATPAC